jgi:hypothetical protein
MFIKVKSCTEKKPLYSTALNSVQQKKKSNLLSVNKQAAMTIQCSILIKTYPIKVV